MPWSTPNVLGAHFDQRFGRFGGDEDWLYSLTQLPGLQALYDATAASTVTYDASNLVSAVADISGNSATGARNLVQATGANQPVYLAHSGTNYGWLNGVAGNYFSTPDAAFPTGDIDLRWFGALPDWTPASAQALISKDAGGADRTLCLRILSGGLPALYVSSDGTATSEAIASTLPTVADRARFGVRATRIAATGVVTFWTSTDGTNWTQLGTTQATTSGNLFNSAALLWVGQRVSTSDPMSGRTEFARVYDGVNGTMTRDFDASAYSSGSTFTASTGEVWTVNGGAHIVTSSGIYFAGVDEYLKTATFTLAQPTTVYLVGSQVTWTDNDVVFDGNASDSGALKQTTSTPNVSINAGSEAAENTGWVLKTPAVITSVLSGASSSLRVNLVTATTGNAGTASMSGFTLASAGTAGSYGNVFVSRSAIFSVAHDAATQNKVIAAMARGLSISL